MATRSTYVVPFRRKREGKTNYRLRLKLLISSKPRIVVRNSKKHVLVQIVAYAPEGDKIIATANTRDLAKLGWQGDMNNVPAAYLVGLLAGRKAIAGKIKEAIPDLGLQHPVKGARIYAALKGAKDAGLAVPIDEKVVPSADRLQGKHIASYAEKLKNSPAYEKQFSAYIKRKLMPEQLTAHIEKIKQTILK